MRIGHWRQRCDGGALLNHGVRHEYLTLQSAGSGVDPQGPTEVSQCANRLMRGLHQLSTGTSIPEMARLATVSRRG